MKRLFLFAFLSLSLIMNELSAQAVDPWITKAYSELYKRTPTTEETKISNYNNGSWSSYPELLAYVVTYNNGKSGNHIKGDPWIFRAYYEMYNRVPIAWELNINNYNNGSWANYDELKRFVTEYQNALVINHIKVIMAKVNSATNTITELAAVFTIDGKVVAADLIGNDAGSLKAVGGAELAAKGITALIGMDGATLIGNDAGSLKNLMGIQFSAGYTTKSGNEKAIKTSGKTVLVIK